MRIVWCGRRHVGGVSCSAEPDGPRGEDNDYRNVSEKWCFSYPSVSPGDANKQEQNGDDGRSAADAHKHPRTRLAADGQGDFSRRQPCGVTPQLAPPPAAVVVRAHFSEDDLRGVRTAEAEQRPRGGALRWEPLDPVVSGQGLAKAAGQIDALAAVEQQSRGGDD